MQDSKWKTLYQAGGLAPLIALLFYCSQFIVLAFGDPYPSSAEGWFALAQRSKLRALWYLNALDIVSFALLGIMFLALYMALRRIHPSWMLIGLYVALLGAAVFIVPRVLTLALLPLSDLHAAATSEAQRTTYLIAGETLSQVTTATPQTLGFLFMASAGLIISIVTLRSWSAGRVSAFGQATALERNAAYVGILGFAAAFANYVSWLAGSPIAATLMPVNGLLWLVWWLLVSVELFRLARGAARPDAGSKVV